MFRVITGALFALALVGMASPGKAALITFEYKNTVDFSSFGGGASDALTMRWTFDDGLTDSRGGNNDVGLYGSISGSIQIGGFSLSLDGLPTRDIRVDADRDRYQVRFAGSNFALGNQTTDRLRLRFNGPNSMFANDALPTTTAFFSSVTTQRLIADLSAGNQRLSLLGPGSLTVVPVPAPSTLAVFSIGLVLLGFAGWRRRFVRGAVQPS